MGPDTTMHGTAPVGRVTGREKKWVSGRRGPEGGGNGEAGEGGPQGRWKWEGGGGRGREDVAAHGALMDRWGPGPRGLRKGRGPRTPQRCLNGMGKRARGREGVWDPSEGKEGGDTPLSFFSSMDTFPYLPFRWGHHPFETMRGTAPLS